MGFRLALIQMRHSARHLVAVCLATMIGVAFVAATLVVGNVLEGTVSNSVVWQYSGASAIVTGPDDSAVDPALLARVRAVDGVAAAENRYIGTGIVREGSREAYPFIANVPTAEPLRSALRMKEGRLPEAPGEVAILPRIAKSLQVDVGDTITFEAVGDVSGGERVVSQKVVGIVDAPDSLAGIAPEVFGWLDEADAARIGAPVAAILVMAAPGVSDRELVDRINAQLGPAGNARTYAEQAAALSAKISGGVDILSVGLMAFAGIALFVAGIVIANTFTVLVTQRTRNLALLRCVGATRNQVRRLVLIEAAGIGLVASVLGIVAGIGMLALALNAWATFSGNRAISTDLTLGLNDLIVPFVLGLGATMVAAWAPSRSAMRVAPLAALRIEPLSNLRSSASRWRVVFAALFVLGGGALLGVGVALALAAPGVLAIGVGMLGGMASFFGIMVAGVLIVPRVVGMMARLLAPFGAPAAIAASNSVRNPKRTTATAMALLVAVTLVTMMSVGAESSKATLDSAIAARSPIDLVIIADAKGATDSLSDATIKIASGAPEVALAMPVHVADLALDGRDVVVQGVDPSAATQITNAPDQLEGLAEGVAIVPGEVADAQGIGDGDTITLAGVGGAKEFRARVTDLHGNGIVVDATDLAELAPDAPVQRLWLRFKEGVDPVAVTGLIQDSIDAKGDIHYNAGAQVRAQSASVLDTMLLVVTMLLGVAVVIALVGVGNTLSLSVIERTRESAVLRAMGLTRSQMRRMLALEGMLIALVGVVLGIGLGIAYGMLGTLTLFGDTFGISLAVPWDRVIVIVAIGLVAGIVASVLPARAALKVSPVAALAE